MKTVVFWLFVLFTWALAFMVLVYGTAGSVLYAIFSGGRGPSTQEVFWAVLRQSRALFEGAWRLRRRWHYATRRCRVW